MTIRIERLPDGRRQRWGPGTDHLNGCSEGDCLCDTGPWLLPDVHPWPFSSIATPQYLSNRPDVTVKAGDTVLVLRHENEERKVEEAYFEIICPHVPVALGSFCGVKGEDWDLCFLISRAEPTEDVIDMPRRPKAGPDFY